jgi:molecular chaperone GrpE
MSKAKHNEHAHAKESGDKEVPRQSPEDAVVSGEQQKVADEIGNLNDQILRLRADFDNLRRRTRREQVDASEKAKSDVMMNLFPVIDHFELGLGSARENGLPESVLQGFQMVFDQLRGLVEKAGVTLIEAEGQPFDPAIHECIAHLPADTHPEGMVMTQTRRGYRMGTQVLRAAQVVVSSGQAGREAEQNGEADG